MEDQRHRKAIFAALIIVLLSALQLSGQDIKSPESVVYDSANERYFLSSAFDGRIRILEDGSLRELGREFKGSHGLYFTQDLLFACYRDSLFIYDMSKGGQKQAIGIKQAQFITDICVDPLGTIYLSDFSRRRIYRLRQNGGVYTPNDMELWLQMSSIPSAIAYNTLLDQIAVTTWGRDSKIQVYSPKDKRRIESYPVGYSNAEDLIFTKNGDAYVSIWSESKILYFDQGLSAVPKEIRKGLYQRPTGLVYGKEGLVVLDERGRFYKEKLDLHRKSELPVDVFPNPMSVNARIDYQLQEAGRVEISLYNAQGVLVEQLLKAEFTEGNHHYMLQARQDLSGLYFIEVKTLHQASMRPITILE